MEPELLVVGAGPVGLMLAAHLVHQQVDVAIIDKAPEAGGRSRGFLLTASALEVFDALGVLPEVLARGQRLNAMVFHANAATERLSFHDIDTRFPFFVSLPQVEIEKILIDWLHRQGVQVVRSYQLLSLQRSKDYVEVKTRDGEGAEYRKRYRFLMACDGIESPCRHWLEGHAPIKTVGRLWIADVKMHSTVALDEIQVFFHSEGVLACVPLPNGRFRLLIEQKRKDQVLIALLLALKLCKTLCNSDLRSPW